MLFCLRIACMFLYLPSCYAYMRIVPTDLEKHGAYIQEMGLESILPNNLKPTRDEWLDKFVQFHCYNLMNYTNKLLPNELTLQSILKLVWVEYKELTSLCDSMQTIQQGRHIRLCFSHSLKYDTTKPQSFDLELGYDTHLLNITIHELDLVYSQPNCIKAHISILSKGIELYRYLKNLEIS